MPPGKTGLDTAGYHASGFGRAGDLQSGATHPELAHIPIIFLTARASETDRIVGLELGANDYIVKPFFIRELIARIKIQFRGHTNATRVLKAGSLELDRSSCQVVWTPRLSPLRRQNSGCSNF